MSLSLSRGIDTIRLINELHAVLPNDVATNLEIPRASAYRILQTLVEKKLLYKHESDGRYRLTIAIECLSAGFTQADQLAEVSRPYLNNLTSQLKWPVALSTIDDDKMVIRENTDYRSPLAVEKYGIDYKISIPTSSTGQCILAFQSKQKLAKILKGIEHEVGDQKSRNALHKKLKLVRQQGYSIVYVPRKNWHLGALSVPVKVEGNALAALTLLHLKSAFNETYAVEHFVPKLKETANVLGDILNS